MWSEKKISSLFLMISFRWEKWMNSFFVCVVQINWSKKIIYNYAFSSWRKWRFMNHPEAMNNVNKLVIYRPLFFGLYCQLSVFITWIRWLLNLHLTFFRLNSVNNWFRLQNDFLTNFKIAFRKLIKEGCVYYISYS